MNRLLLIALSFFVLGIGACKKTKGPDTVKSAQQDNSIDSMLLMTALIDGREWLTDSAYSYKVRSSGNDTGTYNLMISATRIKNDSASTITFNISGYTGKGNYSINPPYNTATYYSGNQRHFATSGLFTVLTDTGGVLAGTFRFTADTIIVMNGTFNVALP